jgi:hypothetical protein
MRSTRGSIAVLAVPGGMPIGATLLSAFIRERQLEPFLGNPQPRLLMERTERLGCFLCGFRSLRPKPGCVVVLEHDGDHRTEAIWITVR